MANDIDDNRSMAELRDLRDLAYRLNFAEDYHHWCNLIEERKRKGES